MALRAGLLRRLFGRPAADPDPVAAFDAEVDRLAAEGAQLRRLLADLLRLRAELRRAGPADALVLARLDEDALVLKEEAIHHEARRARLEVERHEVRAIVDGARAVAAAESSTLRARTRELLELDAARDDAERLAALRALYEEDRRRG